MSNIPLNHHTIAAINYYVEIDIHGPMTEPGPFAERVNFVPFDDYHIIRYDVPDRIVENNRLIVVLTNRFVFSAGEIMVDMIFNIDNTLVIGQNTGGGVIGAGSGIMSLPRSGISFQFSRSVNVHPENFAREGKGIAPDIWIAGDALSAGFANAKQARIEKFHESIVNILRNIKPCQRPIAYLRKEYFLYTLPYKTNRVLH